MLHTIVITNRFTVYRARCESNSIPSVSSPSDRNPVRAIPVDSIVTLQFAHASTNVAFPWGLLTACTVSLPRALACSRHPDILVRRVSAHTVILKHLAIISARASALYAGLDFDTVTAARESALAMRRHIVANEMTSLQEY